MLKSISAIVAAAAIAAAFTLLSAPTAHVDAGPVAKPIETPLEAMNGRVVKRYRVYEQDL